MSQGDWRLFFLLRDRIRDAKLDDVQRVARERLLPSNRTLAHYIPTDKPLRAPAPAMVDVAAEMKQFVPATAVAQVAAFDASPANIDRQTQRATLANGMQLALLPKPTRGNAVQGMLSLRWGDAASCRACAPWVMPPPPCWTRARSAWTASSCATAWTRSRWSCR